MMLPIIKVFEKTVMRVSGLAPVISKIIGALRRSYAAVAMVSDNRSPLMRGLLAERLLVST